MTQAYVFALDPTPVQVSLLRSHIGGTRFVYNALLRMVKNNWDEEPREEARRPRGHQGGLPRDSELVTSISKRLVALTP